MSKDTQGVQECWASRDTKEQERSRGGYELRAGVDAQPSAALLQGLTTALPLLNTLLLDLTY